MDEILPKRLTDVPLLHGVEQQLVLMRIPLRRILGWGLHTWGPERITRMGRGNGCESMTRFYLGDDSGFRRKS